MPDSIADYRKLVEKPWGKMFYDIIYKQLSIPDNTTLNILDYGAGFCVSADYYAKKHNVTAIEPNKNMSNLKFSRNKYSLLSGGIEQLNSISDNSFDVILLHNVLEYVEDKESIIKELVRVLKPNGIFSIVKHNLYGRVISNAVLNDSPETALHYLNNNDNTPNMFGVRDTFSNEYIINIAKKSGLFCKDIFGIRTFFALSSNNKIKYTDKWYNDMLELEMKACSIDEFKRIAFYNHLIFFKGAE